MHCNALGRWAAVGVMSAALAGCTHQPANGTAAGNTASEITAPASIPLAIRGQATLVRLSFPNGDQHITPGEFAQNDICLLNAGEFRIHCATDGSTLDLGPSDSNDLLTDNPMYGLSPLHNDKDAGQSMKLYGILFLVAGSIDRVPGALSDYIQSPGQHLDEAVTLAQLLLNAKAVEFQGFARGGNFTATVELTDDGRDKLLDALDEAGEPSTDIQMATLKDLKVTPSIHLPTHHIR